MEEIQTQAYRIVLKLRRCIFLKKLFFVEIFSRISIVVATGNVPRGKLFVEITFQIVPNSRNFSAYTV